MKALQCIGLFFSLLLAVAGFTSYPTNGNPQNLILAIICTILSIVIIIIMFMSKSRVKNELEESLQGIVATKVVQLPKHKLIVDDTNKKFAITTGSNAKIYNYDDLLDFELQEDGTTVARGKSFATAVGAATFGVAGALVGASGKRKQDNFCTIMQAVIRLNNLGNPQIIVPLISYKTNKETLQYKNAQSMANNLISTLTYIENNK